MKTILFLPFIFYLSFTAAEGETSNAFRRDSCVKSAPIIYSDFDRPAWRAVFSWHYDQESQDWAHYVTENRFAHCANGKCYYYVTEAKRHAGIHGSSLTSLPKLDGTPDPETRENWSVAAVHKTLVPGVGEVVQSTTGGDCNFG